MAEKYALIGIELACKSNISEAKKHINNSLILQESKNTLNTLGLCYFKLGNFNKAKYLWQKSIDKYECNESIRYLDYLDNYEIKKYINCYNEVIKLAKDEKYKDAVILAKKEALEQCEIVMFLNVLALCYIGCGKIEKGKYIFQKSLSLDISNKETIQYIIQTSGMKKRSLISKIRLFLKER